MLTKTQLKILSYLINNQEKSFGIRELGREISTVYYLVQRNVHQLRDKKIISLQKIGKTDLIKFSQQINTDYLIEAEKFKRENIYQKYPHLKIILKKIMEQAKSCFFILIVFGSYVKQPRKDSDLDILIITMDKKQVKLMENVISSVARTSVTKIHDIIVTEKSFLFMLQKKELNVAHEAKEKHILVYGEDLYYKLLK